MDNLTLEFAKLKTTKNRNRWDPHFFVRLRFGSCVLGGLTVQPNAEAVPAKAAKAFRLTVSSPGRFVPLV